MKPSRQRYLLTLDALPGDPPAPIRLRKLLKLALRSFRLRCPDLRELPPDGRERTAERDKPTEENNGD